MCYLETNIDKAEAYTYLDFAEKNGYKEAEIHFDLGEALMHAEKFDEAIAKFYQYKSLEKSALATTEADRFISYCNNAKLLKSKPLKVEIENLGDKVNSPKSDICPFTDYSETTVLFTSNSRFIKEFGEFVNDVITTEFKFGKWRRGKSLSSQINTAVDHEFLVGSSPNLTAVVIRPESYTYSGDLLISYLDKKRYGALSNPGLDINDKKSIESSGCLSDSGDTLYFSSDRLGGFGGFDLYYSLKIGDGWGIPQNLGTKINTPFDEEFPNISQNGKLLYFASNGPSSMGGHDIFVSSLNPSSKEWENPKNFGYPINTTYDDFNITLTDNGRYGYVSQVKKDGVGEYDVYKVTFVDKEPYYVTYTGKVAVGDTASSTPICSITKEISIKVTQADNKLFGEYKLNSNCRYAISLPPGDYEMKIIAEDYPEFVNKISIPEIKPAIPVVLFDVYLNKNAAPIKK
ncbi:MAG: PD40 domain-containing protein [Bacteroidales bacterium]|nr:PD40 domain-containing protein [Bacteroidales bacterium]